MRVERYRYRGAQISTPWNEATVDPTRSRFRRTSHDDPRFSKKSNRRSHDRQPTRCVRGEPGCGGTRTSGSEGGGGETSSRKADTALCRRPLHRTGRRYLTVVVDHDSGRLVWAAAGRDRKTVEAFLDALGETRCKQIELVSCDMASWIAGPVAERLPDAVRCVDPFHVVMLATDALDEVRREVWNEARKAGDVAAAKDLKGARYALCKNPENLTDRQTAKLSSIQKTNARLYRADCSKSSWPGGHPGRMKSAMLSGSLAAAAFVLGACEPVQSLAWESCPEPRTGACEPALQIRLQSRLLASDDRERHRARRLGWMSSSSAPARSMFTRPA